MLRILCLGAALAIGIGSAQACPDKATVLDRVSCEHSKFTRAARGTLDADADLVYAWGAHRRALAADLDHGTITPQHFEAKELELSSGLTNALIAREDRRHAGRVRAQERAAAAAELSAKIEALCMRATGRPCPLPQKP